MYLDTTVVNGMYRVSYIDSEGKHQYKIFISSDRARHWVINHLRIVE